MALITLPTTLADNTVPTAAQFMGNFNAIVNEFNGGITNANISASAAIDTSKLSSQYENALTHKEISTPSNPSAGYRKLYFKSDGLMYRLDSSGAEAVAGGQTSSAHAYHSALQTANNNSNTAMAFDTEGWDNSNIHDTATNNTRLTLPTAGIWEIRGQISFSNNTTGDRAALIRKNGTTTVAFNLSKSSQTQNHRIQVSAFVNVAANDYFELMAFQDSGGPLSVDTGSGETFFQCHRLS